MMSAREIILGGDAAERCRKGLSENSFLIVSVRPLRMV
jgi:hypothetical protein